MPADRPPGRGRRLALVGALVVVVLLGLLGTWWWLGHRQASSGLADPSRVAMPAAPTDVSATKVYLAGPGRPLLASATSRPLLAGQVARPTVADCTAEAAALDQGPGPDQLMAIAQAIPDPATADMAESWLADAFAYLSGCLHRRPVTGTHLAFTNAVLRRRILQVAG